MAKTDKLLAAAKRALAILEMGTDAESVEVSRDLRLAIRDLDAAPKIKPAAKNIRRGLPSKAFPGLRIGVVQKQACGHRFNSAGCAVCPYCERRPAPPVEGYPPEWALQDAAKQAVILEHAIVNGGKFTARARA